MLKGQPLYYAARDLFGKQNCRSKCWNLFLLLCVAAVNYERQPLNAEGLMDKQAYCPAHGKAAATLLGYMLDAGDKVLSICWLMLFISCYRGLFFDTMYAQRQFYSLCRSINKGVEQQWTRHNLATAEGIESYTDDELCLFLRWEEVDAVREDANHLDIYAAEQLVRFEKDSFVTGTAEELVQWLGEKLPHIAIERGKPLYLS